MQPLYLMKPYFMLSICLFLQKYLNCQNSLRGHLPLLKILLWRKSELTHSISVRGPPMTTQLRAKCKRQSKIDYQSYIKNTENSFNRNPSLFWKSIKNLNQKNTIPTTLFWNNDKVDTPLGSANLFSKYFYSMYNNSISPPVNISNINTIPYELPSNCHFSLDDVQLALNSLKNTNSNGPDGISARLLFNCQDSIVYPLFLLFRLSLDEGILFHRKRTCIIHPYSLNGSTLKRVSTVKDLGFYLTPYLSFEHHIDVTVGRALKILGFLKRSTSLFTSATCIRSLYFSLVRSVLEYGSVVTGTRI
ncbi:unnamed protein product [Macrosiphum euphorbiae]|uniref:Uncharacterized protein n=1 Tax=Macrosiphum euphorbiae TaxID=13131 RepID=A0AAV0Y9C4_9HEMI|nr:unnamed protein product [Macrosiphum euphorbiae]